MSEMSVWCDCCQNATCPRARHQCRDVPRASGPGQRWKCAECGRRWESRLIQARLTGGRSGVWGMRGKAMSE